MTPLAGSIGKGSLCGLIQIKNPEEVLHLMAAKYIDTMLEWLPKKKIANFDWQRFVKDVQDLFERQGWLQALEVA
jgi:hypothetical protein